MSNRSRVPLFTFGAVFAAIVVVGTLSAPLLLGYAEGIYLRLQGDVNRRQTQAMTQFIQQRLEEGASRETVLREFQSAIAGSHVDRGYVCLIDRAEILYVSHPDTAAIGMMIKGDGLFREDFNRRSPRPWSELLHEGRSAGGLLELGGADLAEIVYFSAVPGTLWTVSSHENASRLEAELTLLRQRLVLGAVLFGLILAIPASAAARRVSRRYERQIEDRNARLAHEQARSERLLLNVLPAPIAERMKSSPGAIADRYADVSILFCDIVGFTALSMRNDPEALVAVLNGLFSEFDELSNRYGVEKIKTIGDAYMAVSGLPEPRADHLPAIAGMALDMVDVAKAHGLEIRIGLHAGAVVAGVIGTRRFAYDLWGDAVNTAARLEAHGLPGRIHCSQVVESRLRDRFRFDDRGEIEIRGRSRMRTFFLLGATDAAPLADRGRTPAARDKPGVASEAIGT